MPCRQQLSGRILEAEAKRVEKRMEERVGNRYGTGQCDGWKNIAKTSLIAFMVNVEYTPYPLSVADISAEAKTADNLLKLVMREVEYCINVLKVILVAWCTDASGESLKMRKLLRIQLPWIVTIDCWAHQINLIVGDYFKVKGPLADVVVCALEVVKWFNSHSRALGMLRDEQVRRVGKYISLILPVLTRWTSHYLSTSRLLDLEYYFRTLVLDKRDILVLCAGNKPEQKNKAKEILTTIENSQFWTDLKTLKAHLEPLAFATNVTQSDSARLDVVLITLGNLYRVFSDPSLSIEAVLRSAVLKSLEKRWAKADREVFILAVILNPYVRQKIFHPNSSFRTMATLWGMVKRCCERFWDGMVPNQQFRKAFTDYLAGVGEWSDTGLCLNELQKAADAEGTSVDLVALWREHDTSSENGSNGLVRLAMRILSIVANSASTERLLSKFGVVHTRHRNRMDHERTRKIVLVKADVEETYGAPARGRKRKLMQDDDDDDNTPSSTLQTTTSTTPTPSQAPLTQVQAATVARTPVHTNTPSGTTTTPEASPPADPTANDPEAEPNFHQVVQEMIAEVEEDDLETLESVLTSARTTSTDSAPSENSFKLAELFHYPSASEPKPPSLRFFMQYWHKAQRSFEVERDFHEIAQASTTAAA